MSRRTLRLFAFILTTALAHADGGAVIEGRVTLPARTAGAPVNQRYDVVTTGTTITTNPARAVIYLEGAFPKAENPPTAQMVQKGLAFSPTLLPIQVGTRVEFPNEDDTFHNVFSFSKTKRFDLGRYPPNEKPVPFQVFDKPGLITLRCEIHEHMRGLILVLDTPYFTVSETDGTFRLTGLPVGKYLLKAWVNSDTTRSQPVELTSDGTLHLDFP